MFEFNDPALQAKYEQILSSGDASGVVDQLALIKTIQNAELQFYKTVQFDDLREIYELAKTELQKKKPDPVKFQKHFEAIGDFLDQRSRNEKVIDNLANLASKINALSTNERRTRAAEEQRLLYKHAQFLAANWPLRLKESFNWDDSQVLRAQTILSSLLQSVATSGVPGDVPTIEASTTVE